MEAWICLGCADYERNLDLDYDLGDEMIGTALLLTFTAFMVVYTANSAGSYRISRNSREK